MAQNSKDTKLDIIFLFHLCLPSTQLLPLFVNFILFYTQHSCLKAFGEGKYTSSQKTLNSSTILKQSDFFSFWQQNWVTTKSSKQYHLCILQKLFYSHIGKDVFKYFFIFYINVNLHYKLPLQMIPQSVFKWSLNSSRKNIHSFRTQEFIRYTRMLIETQIWGAPHFENPSLRQHLSSSTLTA